MCTRYQYSRVGNCSFDTQVSTYKFYIPEGLCDIKLPTPGPGYGSHAYQHTNARNAFSCPGCSSCPQASPSEEVCAACQKRGMTS